MCAYLCALLTAKSTSEYTKYKLKFLSEFEATQPRYVKYFLEYYDNRAEKWALYHRTGEYASVNTNMFVESFHNKLKTVYFGGKRNRRLDVLVETLLQIENHIYIYRTF